MRRIWFAVAMVSLLCVTGSARAEAPDEALLLTYYTLSPDGKTLVFAWRGDLWSVRIFESPGQIISQAQRLTTHPAEESRPHFSPNGKLIAFNSTRSGTDQIWLMNADGTDARAIDTHSDGARVYGWFPDNNAVLMRARRDHHWRRPERLFRKRLRVDARPQLLFDDYGYVSSIAPDGNRVAFIREGRAWTRKGYRGPAASQIWIYDRQKDAFTQVTQGDHGERWPLWAPDGRHLFCVSQQDGTYNLYRHDLETGKREQLTKYKDDGVSFPVISADGSTMVFRQLFDLHFMRVPPPGRPPSDSVRLAIVPRVHRTVEEEQHVTTTRATDIAFTDDAREIAFVAGGDVWVMDTELREPKRITRTPADERDPVFSPDFKTLFFISDGGEDANIYRATRTEDDKHWWQNEKFKYERITDDEAVEDNLRLSPDGKRLVFTRATGGLWSCDLDGKNEKALIESWAEPDYSFSPDGTWIAYAESDFDFNSDIWVRPTDGSKPAVNVSMHPDNDRGPTWSPDGRMLAFTGRRWGEESDICLVYLQREDHEERKRDRTLEKALEKMKGREKGKKKGPGDSSFEGTWSGKLSGPPPLPKDGLSISVVLRRENKEWSGQLTVPAQLDAPFESISVSKDKSSVTLTAATALGAFKGELKREGEKLTGVWSLASWASGTLTVQKQDEDDKDEQQVDLERIEDRIRRVRIEGTSESGLFWSPDSKKLAFFAKIGDDDGLYTISPPDDLKPKRLVATRGSKARWLKEGSQIAWLSSGVPATVSSKGKVTRFPFSVQQVVEIRGRNQAAFDVAWRAMRDHFYDANMAGRDWKAIRKKYRPMARLCITPAELEQLCNLMLGELNASHMGFRAMGGKWSRPGWKPVTGNLGLRFDPDDDGEGLLIADVVRDGPGDQDRSRLQPGERILKIGDSHVSRGTHLATVLTVEKLRDVVLRVRGEKGEERDVTIRPVTTSQVRNLLYDDWLEKARAHVTKQSDGRLGYLHVRGMNWSSFERFEAELYKIGHGKDGIVIDVRENGGGFTTDHLLTCLTQPTHAFTIGRGGGRGYPQDRMVYARWNKPIVVLCNQNSFSNAEIFSHAIKNLKRGRVVGVRTAGGVISTGGMRIMGMATLRMPFRGWFLASDGADMELNGCVPDIEIWPQPGDWAKGIDRQLDVGIATLLEDVATWKARPQPKARVAPKPWPPR